MALGTSAGCDGCELVLVRSPCVKEWSEPVVAKPSGSERDLFDSLDGVVGCSGGSGRDVGSAPRHDRDSPSDDGVTSDRMLRRRTKCVCQPALDEHRRGSTRRHPSCIGSTLPHRPLCLRGRESRTCDNQAHSQVLRATCGRSSSGCHDPDPSRHHMYAWATALHVHVRFGVSVHTGGEESGVTVDLRALAVIGRNRGSTDPVPGLFDCGIAVASWCALDAVDSAGPESWRIQTRTYRTDRHN